MKKEKKLTKEALRFMDDIDVIGTGKKLTEKDHKEISEAIAKHRAQRKAKKAA